jgi:hypothetical protein
MFERLLRQPGYFAIRQSRATALRIAVYERLARVLAPKALEQPVQPALMHAITPLLRLMKRLPEYSRTTRRVSREAQAIRRALLEAKEPDVTLFETLPCACGLEPFTIEAEPDDPRFDMFFAALREGLQELQDAYPHMVAYAAERVQQAFGAASADLSALHTELVERSRHIREITSDNQLRSLGVRLDTAEDGTAWLESVGALLIRKPMPSWRDEDVQRFELQLADLGQRFCWTERISRVVSTGSASTTMAPDAAEEPLSSSAGWNAQMRELHHSLTTALHSHTLTDEQRIQVLLELLDPLFERTDGEKDI